MPRTDYHTHTPLCMHAEGTPEAFVEKALSLGMSAYGIADHAPMPRAREPFDLWRMRCSELPDYIRWTERAKEAARGTGLTILAGLECDWLPGIAPWIEQLRLEYDWDYLIGSTHYLGACGSVDDAIFSSACITGSTEQDWAAYWTAVCDMVQSGCFDMVGHLDLVKFWNRFPEGELMHWYEACLNAMEGSGLVVALNTAGWHKPCAEQYPAVPLLQELLRRRIPIAINSDAHSPQQLSRDWERAHELLHTLSNGSLHSFELPALHSRSPLTVYGSL